MDKEPKWLRFEKLVADVQKELAPNAAVTHNDHVQGYESEKLRQVDITVKQQIGQYDILVAIDCKDYRKPVDVKDVEGFVGLIKDIRANKGVMVAANGFTDTAKRIGENAGLNMYRLIDTENHDWRTYVSIPIVCDFRGIEQYQFIIPKEVAEYLPSLNPNEIVISEVGNSKQVTLTNLIKASWNSSKLPYEPGEYHDIKFTKVVTAFTKEKVFEGDVLLNIRVKRRLFFGELPLIQIRGFVDEQRNQIITTGFTTDWLDVSKVEREWRLLENTSELAIKPVFELMALDLFEIPEAV
jgi:hypothetical protein